MVTFYKSGTAWIVWHWIEDGHANMIRFYRENKRAFIKTHCNVSTPGSALSPRHSLKRVLYQMFEA